MLFQEHKGNSAIMFFYAPFLRVEINTEPEPYKSAKNKVKVFSCSDVQQSLRCSNNNTHTVISDEPDMPELCPLEAEKRNLLAGCWPKSNSYCTALHCIPAQSVNLPSVLRLRRNNYSCCQMFLLKYVSNSSIFQK